MAIKADAADATDDIGTASALGDVPQMRKCLRCEASFQSEGFGERICRRCKGLTAWRTAASVSAGASRRR